MARAHQPGQALFRAVLPEDVEWKPFPAFPPSIRLAVVLGEPSGPGQYVIRVKVPAGARLMPHRHPEDRVYTVMSGVFYIGAGRRVRWRQGPGLSARQRHRPARRHGPLPLGEVRRVRHPGDGDRPVGLEYLDPRRRSTHGSGAFEDRQHLFNGAVAAWKLGEFGLSDDPCQGEEFSFRIRLTGGIVPCRITIRDPTSAFRTAMLGLDITDLFAFPKPGDAQKSILILNVHPSFSLEPLEPTRVNPFASTCCTSSNRYGRRCCRGYCLPTSFSPFVGRGPNRDAALR